MNKICLTQNNFDKLLEMALNNCQVPKKKQNVHKPISFFGYDPVFIKPSCEDATVGGYSYIDKNGKCKHCPPHYSQDDNDYDIIKQNCSISREEPNYLKKDSELPKDLLQKYINAQNEINPYE